MLSGAFLLAHAAFGQITNPTPYCAAGYDDYGGNFALPHYISNVSLGTLNNTSGTTQYPAPHYAYYNSLPAPDLAIGSTYSLSVTHDPQTSTLHFVAVYIDYNHNNSFSDPGERVLQQTTATQTITNPSVAQVTIPANATPGKTRMRVLVFEDDTYLGPDATPCTTDASGELDWGETEDYDVNITSTTNISDVSTDGTAFLYPNPATSTIQISKTLQGATMAIYNMEGKTVRLTTVHDQAYDISDLPSGQYIVKVISNQKVYTQQLTIAK
jgi:hypothetical protein